MKGKKINYNRKITKNKRLYAIYSFCKRSKILKDFVEEIKQKESVILPSDEVTTGANTVKVLIKSIVISSMLACLLLAMNGIHLYSICMGIIGIYFINTQWIRYELEKEELKLLHQFEKYLGEFRHYFNHDGMVIEAVFDSIEESEYEIALHIQQIYELLEEEEMDVTLYKENAPNKYFVTFLALCQITMIYGDSFDKGKSLFLTNINSLRLEISVEILKRERMKYVFSGLIFLCITPIFFLKMIERWSISNIPELERCYKGSYGMWMLVIIYSLTLVCFICINKLKRDNKTTRSNHNILQFFLKNKIIDDIVTKYIYLRIKKMHYFEMELKRIGEGITIKQFVLQKYLILIISFIVLIVTLLHAKQLSRYYVINQKSNKLIYDSTLEDKKGYTDKIILKYSNILKNETVDTTLVNSIMNSILKESETIGNDEAKQICREIVIRIIEYQKNGVHLYQICIIALISLILSEFPKLILAIKKVFLNMTMEDEVMQFYSIISMLVCIKRMNTEIILDWLENFSEIFKPALIECVDNYSYDDEKALIELKEKEAFPSFVRIVENLEACDKVGVEAAFEEVLAQKAYLNDKRKQDNEILITNKGTVGKVVAYIPLILTIAGYLIIPFVVESVKELMEYVTEFQNM